MSEIDNSKKHICETSLLDKARYMAYGGIAASGAHVIWDAFHLSPDFFGLTTGLISYGGAKLTEQIKP